MVFGNIFSLVYSSSIEGKLTDLRVQLPIVDVIVIHFKVDFAASDRHRASDDSAGRRKLTLDRQRYGTWQTEGSTRRCQRCKLNFTFLTDRRQRYVLIKCSPNTSSLVHLFNPTPTRLLWEEFCHVTITTQILLTHIFIPLSRSSSLRHSGENKSSQASKWHQRGLEPGLP